MPFIAKLLAPVASAPVVVPVAAGDAAAEGSILFVASPEYVLPEGIAIALRRRGRSPLWVRLGPEDRDPGTFLLSLIEGVGRLRPGFGKATLELMRRQPGPVAACAHHAVALCETGRPCCLPLSVRRAIAWDRPSSSRRRARSASQRSFSAFWPGPGSRPSTTTPNGHSPLHSGWSTATPL